MIHILDSLLFLAQAVLVAYSMFHIALLLTGTTRNYKEWSAGVGSVMYIAGIVLQILHIHWPGTYDIGRMLRNMGLALTVLPVVLAWLAPKTKIRLEEC